MAVEFAHSNPVVGEEHVATAFVVWMHETRDDIAVALDRCEVRLRAGQDLATDSSVLVCDGHRDHFQPEAVHIDAHDVLPPEDCYEVAGVVLDQVEVPSLERRVWTVVEPREGVAVDPVSTSSSKGSAVEHAKPASRWASSPGTKGRWWFNRRR